MRSFEKQHFIFTRGKIYPNDWLQSRPYTVADATDHYYVSLANRVAVALRESVMDDAFLDDHHILVSAIILTEWFEDICSGTRIWETVNQECKKRYGTLLPFYDMADYVPGEVNRQDLKLLIWDIVQTAHYNEERIINQENPAPFHKRDNWEEDYYTPGIGYVRHLVYGKDMKLIAVEELVRIERPQNDNLVTL